MNFSERDRQRKILAQLVCGHKVAPGAISEKLLDLANEEGLLALLSMQENCLLNMSSPVRELLESRLPPLIAQSMLRQHEVKRISDAAAHVGMRLLVLKGDAWARWLYSKPYLRECGDIDFLVESRVAADSLAETLNRLGYVQAFIPRDMTFEMTSRLIVNDEVKFEIDIHSRLSNVPIFAELLGFEELWASSIALPGLGGMTRGLCLEHSLLHACIHRAVDLCLHRPNRLKWLYDIYLMTNSMDLKIWAKVHDLANEKGLNGTCYLSLSALEDWFECSIPHSVLNTFEQESAKESLDYRRIEDWRYIQWQNLKALPNYKLRFKWIIQRLIPTKSHLQESHGGTDLVSLLLARLGRAFARIRNRA